MGEEAQTGGSGEAFGRLAVRRAGHGAAAKDVGAYWAAQIVLVADLLGGAAAAFVFRLCSSKDVLPQATPATDALAR